jgi:hypothetical protein
MKKIFLMFLLLVTSLFAQFHTPTINGAIGTGEYGDHTDGQNKQSNFYMTWDNSNLYIAITSSNIGEAAVIYLDKNPLTPINSGTNSAGTIVGQTYDGTNFAELQFRADLVVYVKSSYREYRTADGSGGWSSATTGFGSYADNSSNLREFSIPWSAIGGRPSSFAWFGYVTSSGGFVYNQVPTENAGGTIGTSARYSRYYIVNNTNDASSVKPFSRNSYVFNSTTDISDFGPITVYDFTMNTSGRTITRASSGAWTINGSLNINEGTINFGSCIDKVTVSKDLSIGSSGTLTLSSHHLGFLEVAGDWSNSGTFNSNNRRVVFNGTTSQSISGSTTFDYLRINNSNGVSLSNSIIVDDTLYFDNGRISIGSNNITLNASITIEGTPTSSKMIVCTGSGEVRKLFTGTGSFTFPVGDNTGTAEYSPVTLNFTSGSFGTGAYAAVRLVDAKHPNNTSSSDYITRYWIVNSSGITSFSCNASFVYTDADVNGDENLIYLGRYSGGTWSLHDLTNTSTNTLSSAFSSFGEFTGGESGALPVNLISLTTNKLSNSIQLNWTTATELNNYGFEVERKVQNSANGNWEKIGFVAGSGTSNSPKSYSFTDNSPVVGKNYYRLKQIDVDGSISYSNIVEVEFNNQIPKDYSLSQNYPNPFNPVTTIRYGLANESEVRLVVYNVNGEMIKELVNQRQEAGEYSVRFDGRELASGTYIYRLIAIDAVSGKEVVITKKMVMVK